MDPKRYAVLLCAEDTEYVKKKYGGYFGLFVGMLSEAGERWEVYRVACGEFPADDVLESYDGFVITGSCNDAHGNDLWICKLIILLKKLDSMQKKNSGHLLWPSGIGACSWRNDGSRNLRVGHRSDDHPFHATKDVLIPKYPDLHIGDRVPSGRDPRTASQSRGDGVVSEDRDRDVQVWGPHNGYSRSSEYNKDILLHLIGRLSERKLIVESFAEEVKANLVGKEPDLEVWRILCTNFLKGRDDSYAYDYKTLPISEKEK